MKAPSVLAVLLLGVVLGAGLVVACSDDSPPDADAAVCDCPAAEPPLAGRIVVVSQLANIPAGAAGGNGAVCPSGSTLLSGSCRLDVADSAILLSEVGADRTVPAAIGYICRWQSTSATNRTGTVEAICLVPAPQ